MITEQSYLEAKRLIAEYEKQLDLSLSSSRTCYIMNRTTDNLIFVTIDKEYADRLYESGEYIMLTSQLRII